MNFIAAHKIALLLGLALTGGAIYFLRKRAGGGGGPGSAGATYDNGVPISPYSDSAAPQFSFDFGSLLGVGATVPSGSASQPPNALPSNPPEQNPPLAGGVVTGPRLRDLDWSVEQIIQSRPHQLSGGTPPTVSLPITQPFDSPTPYVSRLGAFVAS